MKILILLLLLSCGGKMYHWQAGMIGENSHDGVSKSPEEPIKDIEPLLPDIVNKEGCSTKYVDSSVDHIVAIVTCEDGGEYHLDEDGNIIIISAPTGENQIDEGSEDDNSVDENNSSESEDFVLDMDRHLWEVTASGKAASQTIDLSYEGKYLLTFDFVNFHSEEKKKVSYSIFMNGVKVMSLSSKDANSDHYSIQLDGLAGSNEIKLMTQSQDDDLLDSLTNFRLVFE